MDVESRQRGAGSIAVDPGLVTPLRGAFAALGPGGAGPKTPNSTTDAGSLQGPVHYSVVSCCIVVAMSFLTFVEFGLVMPSMDSYLLHIEGRHRPLLYSLCMAAFSAGRLVGLPVFGALANRFPMKGLLLGAAALDAAGNCMYALAEVAMSPCLLLLGRLTSGVAAGSGVLASVYVGRRMPLFVAAAFAARGSFLATMASIHRPRAHVGASTTYTLCPMFRAVLTVDPARRTGLMTLVQASLAVAVGIGPCLTILIKALEFHIAGDLRVDGNTGPGFLCLLLDGCLLVAAALFFKSPPLPHKQAMATDTSIRGRVAPRLRPSPGVSAMFVLTFVSSCYSSVFETYIAPYTRRHLGWTRVDCTYWFSALAVTSLCVSLGCKHVSSRGVQDRTVLACLLVSLLSLQVASVALLQRPDHHRWAAVALTAVSVALSPAQNGIGASALSKLVAPEVVTHVLSACMVVGTVGRIVGCLWGGNASTEHGVVFVGTLLLAGASCGCLAWGFAGLGPGQSGAGKGGGAGGQEGRYDPAQPLLLEEQSRGTDV